MNATAAMKVYAAIGKVMATLAKDGIQKDSENKAQGYKFRGIDAVYNALAPAMIDAGLIVIPSYAERICTERESKTGGALFSVTVKVSYTLICIEDGSRIDAGPFYGEAMDSADKATNKAMSAAYKYWAMQTFAIPTNAENDGDAGAHDVKPDVKPRPNTATQVAKDALEAMSPEEQDFIRSHVTEIKKRFPLGDMYGYIEEQRFDTEEKLAVWACLPSDIRSEIKRQQAQEAKDRAARQVAHVTGAKA